MCNRNFSLISLIFSKWFFSSYTVMKLGFVIWVTFIATAVGGISFLRISVHFRRNKYKNTSARTGRKFFIFCNYLPIVSRRTCGIDKKYYGDDKTKKKNALKRTTREWTGVPCSFFLLPLRSPISYFPLFFIAGDENISLYTLCLSCMPDITCEPASCISSAVLIGLNGLTKSAKAVVYYKGRLNILSLALLWALSCCLCCTHVIFNRVERGRKKRFMSSFNMEMSILHELQHESEQKSTTSLALVPTHSNKRRAF